MAEAISVPASQEPIVRTRTPSVINGPFRSKKPARYRERGCFLDSITGDRNKDDQNHPQDGQLVPIALELNLHFTKQGASEFECTGSPKERNGVCEAHKIQAGTLLLNGRYDEMTEEVETAMVREDPR